MFNSLLIIDPQNDFCSPEGSLFVPGSVEDCSQIAELIKKNVFDFNAIYVTMDCHPYYHIAHPSFWRDAAGKNPPAYTTITSEMVKNEVYSPFLEDYRKTVSDYVFLLETHGRYQLTIWPPHCIMGSWGANIENQVSKSLRFWEENFKRNVDYTQKTKSPFTEQYSAIQAEVQLPDDPTTRTNFALIDKLKYSENIFVCGEALSHCVANTLTDLCFYIPANRITVLTDCTSSVKGFESLSDDFIKKFSKRGMKFLPSTEVKL